MSIADSERVNARRSIAPGRLVQATIASAAVAVVLNLLVYFLAPLIFGLELEVAMNPAAAGPEPLTALNVIMATTVPAVLAGLLMAALTRFTARPAMIFRIIAVVALLLSLAGPLTQPVALGVRLTLMLMHLIAAAVITLGMTVWARRA